MFGKWSGRLRGGRKAIGGILKKAGRAAAAREEGEGFIDVLVKMLIVVVVGAVLLTIMRTAVPQMFSDMMTKIRSIFEL
jgi:hypothetical protein